ncbi:MAG: hypothetical protein CMH56_01120 [Myxococcales bacterium]|nr:hypothetical protein [Myxococcales bacterium]|tara:strand:- start:2642 stop:3922 length:1281 start_codon:yes stop_codon:yes gene_type:complete
MNSTASAKSVITCDLEGRIETFSPGAAELFGYAPEEVIGKKRVSLFSPGLVVLEHIESWLKTAVEQGQFETRTQFLRKDGSPIACDIRITPTKKDGQQIGYCGVTIPVPEVDPQTVMPPISVMTRIFAALVIMRAPFLSASIFPVVVAGVWLAYNGSQAFPWLNFWLTLFGVIFLHLSANVFNDYFDGKSGADDANNDYFLPFSGGSRSVELGLITPKGQFRLATILTGFAVVCGIPLVMQYGAAIAQVGLLGALLGFFYTAPPLRLIARRGLGELTIGLCFGPLLTLGTVAALSGQIDMNAFWMGLPLGLLTTGILWINQFPDYAGDKATGKNNLVVTLGVSASRFGYAGIMLGAFAAVIGLVQTGLFNSGALLACLLLPMALHSIYLCFRDFQKRSLITANRNTIILQSLVSLMLVAGLIMGSA